MGSAAGWTVMFVVAAVVLGEVEGAANCSPPPAQAPIPDCYSIVLTMADCLGYVQNGSTQAKPSATCCDGLKSVLKQGPQCLCLVLRDSGGLGIAVNISKALQLPGACGVSALPIGRCSGGSPAPPPTPAPHPPQSSPPPTQSPASHPPQSAPSPATPPPHAAPSLPPQSAPSPATPPPHAAPSLPPQSTPSPATPPPHAAPSLPPQSTSSPSSPPQAPLQPPAASPPAAGPPAASPPAPPSPTAAPSSDGLSPAPAIPPTSDENNSSGADVVAVPLLLSTVLAIASATFLR
ncbi:unnamed protein product [Victoria cruziana]